MSFKQLKTFIILSYSFILVGSIVTILLYEIDLLIGWSLGFIVIMLVVFIMIKYVYRNTDKSLTSNESIE